MTDKHTMKAVTWEAPGVAIVVAFAAVGQANVATVQDSEHAIECRDKLRQPKRDRWDRWKTLNSCDSFTADEEFDRLLDELDADAATIILSTGAFNWLKARLEPFAMNGNVARAKKAMLASLAAAKESDVEVAP